MSSSGSSSEQTTDGFTVADLHQQIIKYCVSVTVMSDPEIWRYQFKIITQLKCIPLQIPAHVLGCTPKLDIIANNGLFTGSGE